MRCCMYEPWLEDGRGSCSCCSGLVWHLYLTRGKNVKKPSAETQLRTIKRELEAREGEP